MATEYTEHQVQLGVWDKNYVRLVVTQGEMDSRQIEVKLINPDGTAFDTTGYEARLYVTEAGGRKVFCDAQITGSVITATVPMMSTPGDAEAQIVLTADGQSLKVCGLIFDVLPSDLDDALSHDDDWSALVAVLADLTNTVALIQAAESSAVDAAAEAEAAAQRAEAEADRAQNAATVSIGNVTTGDPGSQAVVTNTGTASAAVLDFVIPRGDQGPAGPQGPQGPQGDNGVITHLDPGMFGMHVDEDGHLILTHNDNEPAPPLSIQDGRLIYSID